MYNVHFTKDAIGKKLVAMIMVLIMIVSNLVASPAIQVIAADQKEIYKDDVCKVTFQVNSQWDNGFEGQFIIENNGSESIENWKFRIKFPHEITSIWDAKINEQKDYIYTIQYPDWNQKIPVSGKVVIGFNAKKSKNITSPSDFVLLNGRTTAEEEDIEVTYKTTSDWKDAFNGQISIKNNTNVKIEGWELEFDFDKKIKSFWTAKLLSHQGNHYTIRNDEWNSVIKPGETINLGFEGNPGNVNEEPRNYKLTKVEDDIQEEEGGEEEDFDMSKVDMSKDADSDGLPDEFEKLYETDMNNPDTDGDGLTDTYEVEELQTDPTKADTDQNGITDDKEDFDKDGAANVQELNYKTNPNIFDTDGDRLSDGDEINKYKTNPLLKDTDEDGLSDGDEINLQLDPFKAETHSGIKDPDYQIDQKLTEKMIDYNKESKEYQISIDIKASGSAQNHLNVFSPEAQFVAAENRAVLGEMVHIRYVDGTVSKADINFRIAEKEIKDSYSGSSDIDQELKGLKKYQIFYLADEDAYENAGLLLPVETKYDLATNTISASVDELGDYCIIDMNMWLYDLGLRQDSSVKTESHAAAGKQDNSNTGDVASPDYVPIPTDQLKEEINKIKKYGKKTAKINQKSNRQVDLTIVIDVSRSMDNTMNRIKSYIGSLVSRLYDQNITLHVSLVKFTEYKEGQEDNTKVLKTKKGKTWAINAEQAIELISKLEITSGKEETPIDGMGMGRELDYRNSADKYMVLLTDEKCNPVNRYGIKNINEMSKLLKKDKITTCVVTKKSLEDIYASLALETGGKSFDIDTNFLTGIEEVILNSTNGSNKYYGISGMTLTPMLLDQKLTKGGKTDTDKDGLTDSEEINWKLVQSSSPLKLSTVGELIGNSKKEYISNSLERFTPAQRNSISSIGLIPEITRAMKKDMDGDGISDYKDLRPRIYDIDTILLFATQRGIRTDKEGKAAEDLMTNDFSKEQVEKINPRLKENTKLSVATQKKYFMNLVTFFSWNDLQKIGVDLVNKFIEGKGNDYSNKSFTYFFLKNGNTQESSYKVRDKFEEFLKGKNYNLSDLKYEERSSFNIWAQQFLSLPKFTKVLDNFNGMGILVHDIWAGSIKVKNFRATKTSYSGTLEFTYYDHFGLDKGDLTDDKKFYKWKEFRSWFTLQHYKQYNGKYKPFVTVFKYDIDFKGVVK